MTRSGRTVPPSGVTIQPLRGRADVGALLRAARHAAGLSVRELAARTGTSRSAVSQIENGTREPGAGTLLRLLAACGYTLRPEPLPQPPRIGSMRPS
ncbi:MAG: helix-turn-helix transcriptional regulator [Actinomycetota bacterium]|nr:helix-turn-helix transcriptional regulator [Actinomycetota bacterium]